MLVLRLCLLALKQVLVKNEIHLIQINASSFYFEVVEVVLIMC